MAKTLQEILAPEVIVRALERVRKIPLPSFLRGPVHRLENVGRDPKLLQTACGRVQFTDNHRTELIRDEERVGAVTCPECLAVMSDEADAPIIVKARER